MLRHSAQWFAPRLEWPVAALALLIIPALLLEDGAAPELRIVAAVINWVVWLAFLFELACHLVAAPCWRTLRKNWLNVLMVVVSPPFLVPSYLQAVRGIRALRILRLVRVVRATVAVGVVFTLARQMFRHKHFHFVATAAVAIVLLGACGIFIAEGGTDGTVSSFGDALWWSVVTATTVGYGDVSPATLEGRVIAVALMLTGIGVIGVFTATLASFFLENDKADAGGDLSARLDTIEAKLDELLAKERV